jgi:hypothetical protein
VIKENLKSMNGSAPLSVTFLCKRATDNDVFVNASLAVMSLGSNNVDPTVMDRDQEEHEQMRH